MDLLVHVALRVFHAQSDVPGVVDQEGLHDVGEAGGNLVGVGGEPGRGQLKLAPEAGGDGGSWGRLEHEEVPHKAVRGQNVRVRGGHGRLVHRVVPVLSPPQGHLDGVVPHRHDHHHALDAPDALLEGVLHLICHDVGGEGVGDPALVLLRQLHDAHVKRLVDVHQQLGVRPERLSSDSFPQQVTDLRA
jgi:hypothetical protein